jgi:hypothetical protein
MYAVAMVWGSSLKFTKTCSIGAKRQLDSNSGVEDEAVFDGNSQTFALPQRHPP